MLFTQARSAIEGCAWPPVPAPADAAVLALHWQLRETQWWPAAQLAAAQQVQLTELLAYTWQHVPFYRERLEAVGIKPGSSEFRWHALRPLARRELIDHEHDLIASALPEAHGKTSVSVTSGSSGMTVRVTKPAVLASYMSAFMLREIDWHQRDVDKTLAAIRVARGVKGADRLPGATGEGWGVATRALAARGKSHLLHIDAPMADQLAFLLAAQPAYLMTYPSNLQHLLYEIERAGAAGDLGCIEQVRTISEPVSAALRELCLQVLGVKIVDEYSAQEVGSIALQCPEYEHYHVNAESAFVEVLHDDGRRCQPGETGRVFVTPLHNFAMPLLRYDIGDRAEVGGPCPCGRGLPVIKRV
ncbi:MAG: phenylacetate--CoA ligase family protein, partial [Gammaproteobacteria bacterium]|nr:phenylacetate--CoA ligase family protein [Gammaproteobacteria bacterium]